MKTLKIGLLVLVIAIIGIWIYMEWERSLTEPPNPELPKNQFSERIRHEIDSLGKLPDSRFCKDFYMEVDYHIKSNYEEKRLGESQLDNDNERDVLTHNLYTSYAEKFHKQAFYVFNRPDWDLKDLEFIRKENQTLRVSKLLERNSSVDQKLKDIDQIFNKYDEITSFISSCRNFPIPELDLSGEFPVPDIRSRISNAATYRSSNMGNPFVNKCTRLHTGLKEVPNYLFKTHVAYLDKTIDRYSKLYPTYNSQSVYADALYKPVESKIKGLDNEIYSASNFDSIYKRLKKEWEADAVSAYRYFSKKHLN